MRIGSELHLDRKKIFGKLFVSIFGTTDFHSHLRLKPVHRYLKLNCINKTNLKIVEFGCGGGVNAFEIGKYLHNGFIFDGIDGDNSSINSANSIYRAKKRDYKCSFYHLDLEHQKNAFNKTYNIVLLIDIIEHLNNPLALLESLRKIAEEDTIILVSVPTKNYVKYFGHDFHLKVGHVHNGYTINELSTLFQNISGELLYYSYNTGFLARYGCTFFYKYFFGYKYIDYLKNMILFPLRVLDFINNENDSCSLFAVFRLR